MIVRNPYCLNDVYSRCRYVLESSGEDGLVLPAKLDWRSLADSLGCSSSDYKSCSSSVSYQPYLLLFGMFAPNENSLNEN